MDALVDKQDSIVLYLHVGDPENTVEANVLQINISTRMDWVYTDLWINSLAYIFFLNVH